MLLLIDFIMKMHNGRKPQKSHCINKCTQMDIIFHKSIQETQYSINAAKWHEPSKGTCFGLKKSVEGFMTTQ